jgi:hypothetical protein
MGSQGIAAWIAQIAFGLLLVFGIATGELRRAVAALFVVLWVVGYAGLPRLSTFGGLFVTPYVALLDIVLVFLVFKQDVRLT